MYVVVCLYYQNFFAVFGTQPKKRLYCLPTHSRDAHRDFFFFLIRSKIGIKIFAESAILILQY